MGSDRKANVALGGLAAFLLVSFFAAVSSTGTLDSDYLENCKPMELDFIVLEGEQTLRAIEDDIAADLAKVGIQVNARFLPKDKFNEAMVNGDFNMAFSESWGAPYDPQSFASSWNTPDEAYYAALQGMPEPYTQEVISELVKAALLTETEAEREEAWAEILQILHEQVTELPFSGKRIPAVINKRLTGYTSGHQQYDYPAHTLRVLNGNTTVTVAPGSQTGLFSSDTGVGRLDAHTYRPNEFFANNWVYDGLVEYGAGGTIVPALSTDWVVFERPGGGKEYYFNLREGVTFHDGEEWNCSVALLNLNHVLAPPLTTGDMHGWYGLPGEVDSFSCLGDFELVITTRSSYYPLLQELTFIRPIRFMSPNLFFGGMDSDPLLQNSCVPGNTFSAFNMTVNCSGIVGGGVSNGGSVAGTGKWQYVKTDRNENGDIERVHFAINENHWDAPSGNHVEELIVQVYPDNEAVKAALLDGSLDAVMGAGVLTEADVAELKRENTDEFNVVLTEALQNRIVVLNTAKAPTDELANRKTIVHAVDKNSIIEKELAGLAEPVTSLFPKDAPYNVQFTPVPAYDLEKALMLNCPEPQQC